MTIQQSPTFRRFYDLEGVECWNILGVEDRFLKQAQDLAPPQLKTNPFESVGCKVLSVQIASLQSFHVYEQALERMLQMKEEDKSLRLGIYYNFSKNEFCIATRFSIFRGDVSPIVMTVWQPARLPY